MHEEQKKPRGKREKMVQHIDKKPDKPEQQQQEIKRELHFKSNTGTESKIKLNETNPQVKEKQKT